MLSGRLVHLIEANCDQIVTRVIHQIRHDPELRHIHTLPDGELREWGGHILENLGDWLTAGKEEELRKRYEHVGRLRFAESIPLYEAVHGLLLVKNKMIDFVQEQAMAKTTVQVYAEEELEHRVDRFFDILVCHLVRGYEHALRQAAAVG
jgi:hypothetical protein